MTTRSQMLSVRQQTRRSARLQAIYCFRKLLYEERQPFRLSAELIASSALYHASSGAVPERWASLYMREYRYVYTRIQRRLEQ